MARSHALACLVVRGPHPVLHFGPDSPTAKIPSLVARTGVPRCSLKKKGLFFARLCLRDNPFSPSPLEKGRAFPPRRRLSFAFTPVHYGGQGGIPGPRLLNFAPVCIRQVRNLSKQGHGVWASEHTITSPAGAHGFVKLNPPPCESHRSGIQLDEPFARVVCPAHPSEKGINRDPEKPPSPP